jgi:hypothetical protein
VAKEKDEGAERNPETKGRIGKRRREKAELSRDYKDGRDELPDGPRDEYTTSGFRPKHLRRRLILEGRF